MNTLSTVGESLRHTDTLMYMLQQKQEDHEKSACSAVQRSQQLWKWRSVDKLREKLADVDRHLYAHEQTTGKTLQDVMSEDEADVFTQSLLSIKVCLRSLVNMSSQFFRADDMTPPTVNGQVTELIALVEGVKKMLHKYGVYLDVVEKGTTTFFETMSDRSPILRDDESLPRDELLHKKVQMFRNVLKLVYDLRQGDDRAVRNLDLSNGDGNATGKGKPEELFRPIPAASQLLINVLTKREGMQDQHLEDLLQMETLWSAWKIERRDISFQRDEFNDKVWLGQGATSVVYAGFLDGGSSNGLPVAVKMKPMKKTQIPDLIREVFLHCIVQHHRIVTLFGMWYPFLRGQQAWIVFERMARTLADALENAGDVLDRGAILRDIAAALAHLHDRGIVHYDVNPGNILLNEDGTQAKLAGFGSSQYRSSNTTMTGQTQQGGTSLYLAPEVRENPRSKIIPEMDCWAFGLIMCEVMHPTGRSTFVATQHADLHGAGAAWADDISDTKVRVAAEACLMRDSEDRPGMREVYLHLTGVVKLGKRVHAQSRVETGESGQVCKSESKEENESTSGVCDSDIEHTSATDESQEIAGRNWRPLSKVNPSANSKRVKICVVNKTDGMLELCRTDTEGLLRCAMRVKRSASRKFTKMKTSGGQFFVLRDGRTRLFHAAFVAKTYGVSVEVGPNYVRFEGGEYNPTNKGGTPWPLRSAASSVQVALTLENNLGCEYRVRRLDGGGRETPLIEKLTNSKWTGHVPGGSVLVFRVYQPEDATWDKTFDCAVAVPTVSPGFTIRFC